MKKINKKEIRIHSKASEKYIDVDFSYKEEINLYSTSVPLEYRRTGTEIPNEEIDSYLEKVYVEVHPSNWGKWKKEQDNFWNGKPRALVTRYFFDFLAKDFDWCCSSCCLPKNPNFARRIQDIKEFGYTLATNTKRYCLNCNKNTTQIILIPLKRGGITGYETWNSEVRNKIIKILNSFDTYEAKNTKKEGLLPDHKFPEIRWDEKTKRASLDNISDTEISRDFQLLSNQRNQQKREVCRNCFQTGKRGIIYGIPFFYTGTELWGADTPKNGKSAEIGCVGCGWYDINKWRIELIKNLNF